MSAAARVADLLTVGGDADDLLRQVVAALAAEPGATWAGIAFLEAGSLALGPSAGVADEGRRAAVPILYQGAEVGELRLDGDLPREELERVASLIAPLVLIGWDTGGETWEP